MGFTVTCLLKNAANPVLSEEKNENLADDSHASFQSFLSFSYDYHLELPVCIWD